MRLLSCVVNRASTSCMQPRGSWPLSRADCRRLITIAARWPPISLPAKGQCLRLTRQSVNLAFQEAVVQGYSAIVELALQRLQRRACGSGPCGQRRARRATAAARINRLPAEYGR